MIENKELQEFDDETAVAISAAFQESSSVLRMRLGDHAPSPKTIEDLKDTLIRLAKAGERDALVLSNRALSKLGWSVPSSGDYSL